MSEEEIKRIIDVLNEGKSVILPSDTVYGIFADATNEDAIKEVNEIKMTNKPHLIVINNLDMLYDCVKNITPLHRSVIDKYWPNTLTILFEKKDNIPDILTNGSSLLGVRMIDNDLIIKILNKFNKPLLSTSANITNEKVITNISLLDERIKSRVGYIYDGGTLGDTASTIIKIENNKIVFLREGKLATKIKKDFNSYL